LVRVTINCSGIVRVRNLAEFDRSVKVANSYNTNNARTINRNTNTKVKEDYELVPVRLSYLGVSVQGSLIHGSGIWLQS